MSNLSELLPAGAGAKSASFVASGTLASGQAVALKSNGQVEAITGVVEGAGTPTTYLASGPEAVSSAYDPIQNVFVVCYRDGSGLGQAAVGSVSGTTISFATPVVVTTSYFFASSVVYDANAAKFLVVYHNGSSGYVDGVVGTVSSGTISFGSIAVLRSNGTNFVTAAYNTTQQKTLVFYARNSGGNYGYGFVATISGTSVSSGTDTQVQAADTSYPTATYNSTADKIVLAWRGSSSYGYTVLATISGTSVSFGTIGAFNSAATAYIAVSYDTVQNSMLYAYQESSGSFVGYAACGQVSGAAIAFGSRITFMATNAYYMKSVYVPSKTSHLVTGGFVPLLGTYISVSGGTTPTAATGVQISAEGQGNLRTSVLYDSSLLLPIVTFKPSANVGASAIYNSASSNNTSFVGITDEAISSAASGSVIVQGGVITNTGLIPLGPSLGTRTAFSSVQSQYVKSTFDSSNNKIVTVYTDNNNYGVAVVGTVSGLSISFGTPVIFNSNQTNDTCATFDTNYNKVFISYANSSTFPQGRVGTVSGTSISFGSENAYINSQCINIAATFDSNLNKVVVAYADSGNSGYAKSQVITLDGGASPGFSYGTPVVFNSKNTEYITSTFDSSNNKVVLAYAASDNTNGVRVGTVSGSAISFGTELAFHAASQASYISSTFDTTNNKVVLFFSVGGANSGEAVVGTVSGTNITLGTQVRVGNSTSINFTGVCFDSSQNKIMLAYRGVVGGTYLGRLAIGTVSGTSITVADSVTFNAVTTAWNGPIFDSNANRTAIIYQDGGSPYNGYGIVVNLTADLAIGTDYFVQTDGTISTTSSTVPAGRALSTTSMLLEG